MNLHRSRISKWLGENITIIKWFINHIIVDFKCQSGNFLSAPFEYWVSFKTLRNKSHFSIFYRTLIDGFTYRWILRNSPFISFNPIDGMLLITYNIIGRGNWHTQKNLSNSINLKNEYFFTLLLVSRVSFKSLWLRNDKIL